MKKTFLSIAIVGIAGLMLVVSCQKSYSPVPHVIATPSLDELFSGLKSDPENFNVPAGEETILYASQGTMIHFYPNSFKDADGKIITSGTINVKLIEMYRAGDMISNRATTMANGQLLQSGGQVNITATLSGTAVFPTTYGIAFKHGTSSSASMSLFYGGTSNAATVATWTQSDTSRNGTVSSGTRNDTNSHNETSLFIFDSCTSFNWINCDCFHQSDSPKTTVSVILPDSTFNPTNTELFLVLPNITRHYNPNDTFTAVMSSVEQNLGRQSYTVTTNTMNLISEGQTVIVPAGLNYQLIVMTNKNGTWYYYEQQGVIPHNGLVVTATLLQTTQQNIKNQLSCL